MTGSGKTLRRVIVSQQCAVAALSLIVPLLAGCGGSGSASAPAIPTPTVITANAINSDGLTGTLTESAATVPVGSSIQYTLALTNTTNQAVLIHAPYFGQTPSVVVPLYLEVDNSAGNRVYPSTSVTGLGAPSRTLDETLQPGQTISEVVPVSGFTTKGLYTARAQFLVGSGQTVASAGPINVLAQ